MSVVFTLLALEGGFRLFYPQQHFSVHVNIWDREMGMKQIPGATGCIIGPEFRTDVVINSRGLRDTEHSYAKQAGTKRILCLGDSFVFGYGVQANETFPRVLEDLLNAACLAGEHWEVINAGVCGTGTAHQLAYFTCEGCRYEPDLVLLCFCGANDFVNNRSCGLFRLEGEKLIRCEAHLSRPERLRTLMQRLPGYRAVFGRSHLVTCLKHRIAERVYARHAERPKDPARVEARRKRNEKLTRMLLGSLRDSCRQENAGLMMMVVPNANASEPLQRIGRLIEFANNGGISYIDLAPRFHKQARQGNDLYYPIDGHWNEAGHRLAAHVVFDFLM